ncbi:DUF3126 family protein [Aerophototrophica crusticola]|uniref:DUF3126 family protein n=1 Tax=Aerophototrophica crusticola TaxID=1709002 RepID=A0A858R7Y6_9PROT|nr:DUF3126 family protein [Rhodospirillaceae bacterium B3]
MTPNEIARLQAYLRKTFGNEKVTVNPPAKKGQPVEVTLGDEFIGTLYRDEDEGEVSYTFSMSILEEDLPAAAPTKGK